MHNGLYLIWLHYINYRIIPWQSCDLGLTVTWLCLYQHTVFRCDMLSVMYQSLTHYNVTLFPRHSACHHRDIWLFSYRAVSRRDSPASRVPTMEIMEIMEMIVNYYCTVFFTLSDVLCVRCPAALYCTVLHSSVLYCIKRGGWKRKKLENLLTSKEQSDNQTIRRFKDWDHSNPLWILEGAGQ